MKILSTKSISSAQKKRIEEFNIEFIAYDAIKITPVEFDTNIIVTNAIITSKNAAQRVINEKLLIKHCFCVGEQTKLLLESHGLTVKTYKKNSTDLANYIIKKHRHESFWYFCGSRRLDNVPFILKNANIILNEVTVYETSYNLQRFTDGFVGVLFFSPSGVESFISKNSFKSETTAYCIGVTTAETAKKYTDNIIIAASTSIESVIDSVIKQFSKNDKKRLIS